MQMSNPQDAFEAAIAAGVLSADEYAPNYAGRYMYMGDNAQGAHLFKNRETRAYIAPVQP